MKRRPKKAARYYEGSRPEVTALLPAGCRRVLEVGCGAGGFRENLPADCEYWGIEPATGPAAIAATRLGRVLTGLFDDVCGELPRGYFDVIICNDVIEHMPDHDAFFWKIQAYLSPEGCIVGSVPNVRCYQNLYELLFERDWRYRDEGTLDRTHLRFFTRKSLLRTLKENLYQVEAFTGLNDLAPARLTSLKKLRRWLSVSLIVVLTLGLFSDIRYLQFGFRIRPVPSGNRIPAQAAPRRRLFGLLRRQAPRASCFPLVSSLVTDKRGLEIGGPSSVFRRRGILPVYPLARSLDNCTFAGATVWEGELVEGRTFRYDSFRRPGVQYIAEASDLAPIPSGAFDFVLSSHVIEHSAKTLAALREMVRVVRTGGTLVILLPHFDGTFDHRRPVTTLQHMIDEDLAGIGEDDLAHIDEVLALHDLARDPAAGTPEEFAERCRRNHENRCIHHHVFDTGLAVRMLDHVGVQLLAVQTAPPFHIILVAKKLADGSMPDNTNFTAADAPWRRDSVFGSDHAAP